MERIITVKGIGNAKVKPDLIVLSMDLKSKSFEYNQTMIQATTSMENLLKAIESVGFNRKDVKTSFFDIRTKYEQYREKNGNYKSKFDGYICEQHVKLSFELDLERLASVLNAVTIAEVNPEMSIQFSVKDTTVVTNQLLIEATKNAREKAEVLANASNVQLGDLVTIDYNWQDIHLYSPTNYNLRNNLLMEPDYGPEIEPEEISAHDTVTCVWEIKS